MEGKNILKLFFSFFSIPFPPPKQGPKATLTYFLSRYTSINRGINPKFNTPLTLKLKKLWKSEFKIVFFVKR